MRIDYEIKQTCNSEPSIHGQETLNFNISPGRRREKILGRLEENCSPLSPWPRENIRCQGDSVCLINMDFTNMDNTLSIYSINSFEPNQLYLLNCLLIVSSSFCMWSGMITRIVNRATGISIIPNVKNHPEITKINQLR